MHHRTLKSIVTATATATAAAGVLIAAVVAVGVAPASAAPPATLYAVVNANGTLARATTGTSSSHPATGQYAVRFSRSIKGCQPVANLGYPGTSEVFTFVGNTTVQSQSDNHTVVVTMTFPGATTAGNYPNAPELRDNSFHLGLNCRVDPGATVKANGRAAGATGQRTGVGRYVVDFGQSVSGCAPVATVITPIAGAPSSLQAHMALGPSSNQVSVLVTDSQTTPTDAPFSLVVACASSHAVFASSNGFYNSLTVPSTAPCALIGAWYSSTSQMPSNQGYVSTWSTSSTTAGVQTKNGGYGVQNGFGADLAVMCG